MSRSFCLATGHDCGSAIYLTPEIYYNEWTSHAWAANGTIDTMAQKPYLLLTINEHVQNLGTIYSVQVYVCLYEARDDC